MKQSVYDNPESRPFAAFYNDMSKTQKTKYRQTRSMFNQLNDLLYDPNDQYNMAAEAAFRLRMVMTDGAYFSHVTDNPTYYYNKYTEFGGDTSNRGIEGPMSFWYETETRQFVVLEWNKVRGIVEKSYRPHAFFKKFFKTYTLNYDLETLKISEKTFEPYYDVMFPNTSEFKLVEFTKPSELYTYTSVRSCMVGNDAVKFYDTAPCVGMGIMYRDTLIARAIVWTFEDGRQGMGRLYSNSIHATSMMENWAAENGVLLDRQWDDTSVQVVAAVSEHGMPYHDNFHFGVRVNESEVRLFTKSSDAQKFIQDNEQTLPFKQYFSLHCQRRGESELVDKLIMCENGWALGDEAIEYKGKMYNYSKLFSVDLFTLPVFKLDSVVKHPYDYNKAIYAGLLYVEQGQLKVKEQ